MAESILVVEDNLDTLEILCSVIRAAGFSAIAAPSGKSALEILGKQSVTAVVLDIMMPGMDGLQVLDHIRNSPPTRELPVVVCSAKGEAADLLAGYEHGADYYLPKPCSQKQIVFGLGMVLHRNDLTKSPGRDIGEPVVS